jgi:hypothetical protein
MRNYPALEHDADYTCPVTAGIFLRIVAEANFEKLQQGKSLEDITPFWRVVEPNSTLSKKTIIRTRIYSKPTTSRKHN